MCEIVPARCVGGSQPPLKGWATEYFMLIFDIVNFEILRLPSVAQDDRAALVASMTVERWKDKDGFPLSWE